MNEVILTGSVQGEKIVKNTPISIIFSKRINNKFSKNKRTRILDFPSLFVVF
jgi:hypothetical protein